MFGLEERAASSLFWPAYCFCCTPTLVVAATIFNVQSVVYFVCWLNKCVVRMTNTMFWKSLHGSILLYGTHFPLVDNMQPTDEGPIEKPIINWKGGSHMNPAQVHAHGPLNINN